ncbi:MAG: DEAD/DEAH box helicase, partial [Magnetovibrio sp.]|nr:DEAD/DEAH box helicase [Magnetovibrio sp.]
MTQFEGVTATLGQALQKRGYEVLTPVQVAMLAPELRDADALVSAQTGSGKTVAFGLALAPTLLNDDGRFGRASAPLALVVAPTRELALQVKRELEWLYAETGASVASCVGGMDMRMERRNLQRGVHIVVGTPGRLRDHIERGSLDTSAFKAVVLDEADEMLDLGFRDDLEYILGSAPSGRRTLMFSATVPRSILGLAKRYQRDAIRISTQSDSKQHLDIQYKALTIAPNDRENAIINMLRFVDAKSTIIFCATRATVNHMTSRLNNRGFSVVALSGELSQNERTHALQAMRDGRARVCVATDVAARGIDLPNLDLVIHADIPKGKESLLHRSGRTGRAGRKGVSVLMVPHNWRKRTERLLQNAKVEAIWEKPPSVDDIVKRDRERILDDPNLSAELSAEDQAFATELLERHGAERIAAAFLNLRRADMPAAEELIDAGPGNRPEAQERTTRNDFSDGVWFQLSVGRKHNAEPRWLLPMLCRAGHITKREIGSIKIQQNETFVEIEPGSVDKFLEAIGPSRKIEKSITVDRLDGVPDAPKRSYDNRDKPGRDKPFGKKKSYGDDKPRDKKYDKKQDKKTWADKPRADKPQGDKPRDKPRDDKPRDAKPRDITPWA